MNSDSFLRYSKNINLFGFGIENQQKLTNAKILVVGLGGLGSACAANLCANGVGTLGLVDNDIVEVSNLHRQILYNTLQKGKKKINSAEDILSKLNPNVKIEIFDTKLHEGNIEEIFKEFDIIVDCTDNLSSHQLINRACIINNKRLVVAGVNQYEGFIFSVIPHISPCYRCLYKDVQINRIVHQGVFGPTVNMLGAFQASEAIKLALDSKDVLINKMILINLYNNQLKSIILNKDSNCPVCGII